MLSSRGFAGPAKHLQRNVREMPIRAEYVHHPPGKVRAFGSPPALHPVKNGQV